ncbi:hypothetical protein [Cylindrospermopsis raciborskii]|uniref:Uncharacterized protein n=1 Tax=Cylindrospermopsis raciborskii CS-506_A TaxID=2585140 RepID=A0A838WQI6_9CYAN|nr:hypothetical protein [Cylindrospermopsis raciborskii]MBA4444214.1 hypothetical protein [Cylindrospermopsis raciborskii CS-506_C]MBA4448434.1 hypothetical protein [Cylindrospermopsis raciborskii CS-506_D]MBA4455062.1 hypothetical protein [Cylindrospermopsis raciborskii CS-506_B]MBA4464399.1 hypothetical protein [Cylindrospermopsis raciborskii CS-506_A]
MTFSRNLPETFSSLVLLFLVLLLVFLKSPTPNEGTGVSIAETLLVRLVLVAF